MGEMGRSYSSANPSALIILHPASIIPGCAGWPGQERTFYDFPAPHSSSVPFQLPIPAVGGGQQCFGRGLGPGGSTQLLPRARPPPRRQLRIPGRAISAPRAPQHVQEGSTQSVYFGTYAVLMLPAVLLPLITLGVIFSSLVPGATGWQLWEEAELLQCCCKKAGSLRGEPEQGHGPAVPGLR